MIRKSKSLIKDDSISSLPAYLILRKINKNELSINQVLESFLKRIKLYNNQLKVFKSLNLKNIYKQLLNQEQKNDKKLNGIPVAVKDIFNTEDLPNTMGSKIYENYLPGNDSRIVNDVRVSGGLILGKSYASEFAVHNPSPTLNPFNFSLSPGTSSGASAVAVASKMVPISIGSQTAGSIIRPASYCGVYGFKPSFGVIARTGVLKTADTLDTIGFFANCVEDLKIIFDTTRQKGRNYPILKKKLESHNYQDFKKKKFIIGIIKGPKSKSIDKFIKKQFDNFLQKITNKNIKIINCKLPKIFNKAHHYHNIIYSKSLSYYLNHEFDNYPQKFSVSLKNLIKKGKKINLKKYLEAINYQNKIIAYFENTFDKYDFLIDLSTFNSAPLLKSNGVEDHNLIWTMGHLPSISLPILKDQKGLPVGIQINSKKYTDYKLLKFAKKLSKKI